MTNPDFILLAQAMGVHAIRCETLEQLPAKMKEFLEYSGDKPVLMECLVETNEHVFPMVWSSAFGIHRRRADTRVKVPAGKALHEQILHKSLRPSEA
jgi:acetolactate synthase-1/2/3 large subunit